MNTGYFDAVEINKGTAKNLDVDTLTVNEIFVKDNIIKSDLGTSARRIKELYESQPNTNTFTDNEKLYLKELIGNNSCISGGLAISGVGNRITGKSRAIGSNNTLLANNCVAIGNKNTIIHDNCTLIGNDCMSTKSNQTIIGGSNLSFKLPFIQDVLENDLQEQAMSICLDPTDGSLVFKVKYMNEIRLFKAPTYGQTIKLNTVCKPNGNVSVSLKTQHM